MRRSTIELCPLISGSENTQQDAAESAGRRGDQDQLPVENGDADAVAADGVSELLDPLVDSTHVVLEPREAAGVLVGTSLESADCDEERVEALVDLRVFAIHEVRFVPGLITLPSMTCPACIYRIACSDTFICTRHQGKAPRLGWAAWAKHAPGTAVCPVLPPGAFEF